MVVVGLPDPFLGMGARQNVMETKHSGNLHGVVCLATGQE